MQAKLFADTILNSTLVKQRRPSLLRTACLMNVQYFPWDVQTCSLEFGSWSYPIDELDYHISETGFSFDDEFIRNQEWFIHELSVTRELHQHDGKDVSTLEFEVILWRMPMYYIFNLVIPTVIITIISFMGLFSLTSSSGERGEKVSLGMGTILALAVVMLMVQDSLPNTSLTTPMISWYFLILIVLIALALMSTVFIVRLQNYETIGKPIPPWVKSVCRVSSEELAMDNIHTNNRSDGSRNSRKRLEIAAVQDLNQELLREIACSLKDVKYCMKEMLTMQKNQIQEASDEYHLVATKLEFVCFIFFTVTTLIVTSIYLFLGYTSR